MTEAYEDDFLVRVRAQVMARDESTEGWLPLAGGGLANVSIRKRCRLPPDVGGHEYIIFGQRISDQTVILSCVINRDLQYFKVMPTFHHWRAGKQRNGLTFQTAADARAFDKGIIRAYDDLIDDMSHQKKYEKLVGEDEVFMTLDLPLEPSESRSNSEGSGSHNSVDRTGQHQANIQYISCDKSPAQQQQQSQQSHQQVQQQQQQQQIPPIVPGENYSYVQLTAVHDYNYPIVDEPVSSMLTTRRDSTCSLKKSNMMEISQTTPTQGFKDGSLLKTRLRCRYCQDFYTDEWNRKGACEFAPDCFKTCIEHLSGMKCARCMLYHCMRDAEGDTVSHPCSCNSESGCTTRWLGLALLSLIVPCLWCYPPLRACHWVGVSCGICGGKHKSQT